MSQFSDVLDHYLEDVWLRDPVLATYVGIHKYDDQLGRFDYDSIDDRFHTRQRFLTTFKAINPADFTPEELLDYAVVTAELEAEIELHGLRDWERSPQIYVDHLTNGVYFPAVRNYAPLEKRLASVAGRLRQVPNLLETAKRNLKGTTPPEFVEIALQMAAGAKVFLEDVIPQLAEQVPYQKEDVTTAIGIAVKSLAQYSSHLESMRGDARGTFSIGSERFDFLLRHYHLLDMDSRQLREFGEQAYQDTLRTLETVAAEIDPGKTWTEIVDELKKDHPPAEGILAAYSSEMEKARDFCRARGLVTFPAAETLSVVHTPVFLRAIIPYAAYEPPAPFDESFEGLFYVTPPSSDVPAEVQEQQLQGHGIYGLPVVALHEGYPGHHLQLTLAKGIASKVRRQFWSTVFGEGWALYCEEMMREEGFYDDPRVRLLQAKNTLWRAARVIVDVGLHADGMSFQEAVDFMVEKAKLERPNAEAEVRRYTMSPTQPMSYLVGKALIMEIRKEYQARLGDKFNLREFHDKLLSYGAIQPKLVRQRMLA